MDRPTLLRRCLLLVSWLIGCYRHHLVALAWTHDPRWIAAEHQAHTVPVLAGPVGAHPERSAGHVPPSDVERIIWAQLPGGIPG